MTQPLHDVDLTDVRECAELMGNISVAYVMQRLINLENTLASERADHVSRIETLERRLADAGDEFVKLRKRVAELETTVSHLPDHVG